jgi:hypothetical protein
MKNIIILPFLMLLAVSCVETFTGSSSDDSYYGVSIPKAPKVDSPVESPKVVLPNLKTENFIQKAEASKLDILWVVDNSGSMANEQADLINNFDIFIQDFITSNSDFKMAITTTDPRDAYKGLMVPGCVEKLNSQAAQTNQAQFMLDFKELVNVGTKGSGNEQGLIAVNSFHQRYPTYFRPDAYLAIVYISDEQDSSPGSPDDYLAFLLGLKSSPGLVKAYSIVDKFLKNTGSGVTTGFDRYGFISSSTNGVIADITSNFAGTLATMSSDLILLLDSIPLAGNPKMGTLKVYVNDIAVTGFTYDNLTRSIRFSQGSVPVAGAMIKVVYEEKEA